MKKFSIKRTFDYLKYVDVIEILIESFAKTYRET